MFSNTIIISKVSLVNSEPLWSPAFQVCGPPGMMKQISGEKAKDWTQGEVWNDFVWCVWFYGSLDLCSLFYCWFATGFWHPERGWIHWTNGLQILRNLCFSPDTSILVTAEFVTEMVFWRITVGCAWKFEHEINIELQSTENDWLYVFSKFCGHLVVRLFSMDVNKGHLWGVTLLLPPYIPTFSQRTMTQVWGSFRIFYNYKIT